jgi:hypothetical protein
MTASALRAITSGQVLACSPVVLVDESGRRYELVGRAVTCERKTDGDGKETPAGVPVLTLVVRTTDGQADQPHGVTA